jgi:hypothetical protein
MIIYMQRTHHPSSANVFDIRHCKLLSGVCLGSFAL